MEISNKLPQFDHKKAVIIVAGKQAADIYLAYQGEMKTQKEIRVETPEYSDREGHFERRSKGKTLGAGSVYEDKDEKTKADFHNQLQSVLKEIKKQINFESVIFLRPSQHKQEIKNKLPKYITNNIVREVGGNFVDNHPDDILKRISENGS
jgi:hypothetical protein